MPIIGDLWRINPSKPVQSEAALAATVGSLFELELAGGSLVVATDDKAIASISNEDQWCKYVVGPFLMLREGMTGRGLLTAKNSDPLWEQANTVLQPGFAKQAMRGYHPAMHDSVAELCELWSTSTGRPIDVPVDMNRLTSEIIARAGFGTTFNELDPDNGDELFSTKLSGALAEASAAANSIPGIATLRKMRLAQKVKPLREAAAAVARQPTGTEDSNLLARMCPVTGATLPEDNIVDQCMTFLAAGNETTASTLAVCLHYLSLDPELQDAVRDELTSVGGLEALTDYDTIAKLRLTRRIVDESLRLWPVAPGYFRRAKVDCTIESRQFGTVEIPKNTIVMALTLGAHRDTATWGPDADQFRPDRFLSENLRAWPDRVYRPFGVGPRSCIGRQFALHEAVVALAMIVGRFTLAPESGHDLTMNEQITLKPHGLRISVSPR